MTALKLVTIASVLLLCSPAWAQDDPLMGKGGRPTPPEPITCPEIEIPECEPGQVTVRETFRLEGTAMSCHRYSVCHDRWNPPPPPPPDPCEECSDECREAMQKKLDHCIDYAGEDYDPDYVEE